MANKPKDLTALIKELDDIVAWFEDGGNDVAAAVSKYEQGLSMLEEVEQHLKAAKLKVKKLEKKFDI